LPEDVAEPIWESYILTLEEAEAACNQTIPPQAVVWAPQGNRMIVVRDPVSEKVGKILMTEEHQGLQVMSSGTIIAVGPTAGLESYPGPAGNIRVSHPRNLLGMHVTFGYAAGKAQRYSVYDSEYDTQVVILTPFDIYTVDTRADHWTEQQEFEEAYAQTKQAEVDRAEAAFNKNRDQHVADREAIVRKRIADVEAREAEREAAESKTSEIITP